jgi:hypothetical protein
MCDNYIGISLLSTTYINLRFESNAEQVVEEYEAGFRKGRSTMDHRFTMKQISEKRWEHSVVFFYDIHRFPTGLWPYLHRNTS